MYVVRREFTALPGTAVQLENFHAQLGGLAAAVGAAGGFRARMLLASLGYPGKYVTLGFWDTYGQAKAFARSMGVINLLAANPPGGFSASLGLAQAYEIAVDVGAYGNAGGVSLVDWQIDVPNAIPAFIQSRTAVFGIMQTDAPGFVVSRLLRHMGQPNHFTALHLRANTANLQLGPVVQQAVQAAGGPANQYTTRQIVGDRFEVVQQV